MEDIYIIPVFNSDGRLCDTLPLPINTSINDAVRVPFEEFDRFSSDGKQYEIIDGVAVFNPALEPVYKPPAPATLEDMEQLINIMLGGNENNG